MNTNIDVEGLGSGIYKVRAVEGQVATSHQVSVDDDFLSRIGLGSVDGATVLREACDILVEHEAMTALPGEATLEQLVVHYPYLSSELQRRLQPPSSSAPAVESVRKIPMPVEDHPTHT